MRLRSDINIHAQCNGCLDAAAGSNLADRLDLLRAFGIDLANACIQRGGNLVGGLADTGKNDLAGRNAGCQRAGQLAP